MRSHFGPFVLDHAARQLLREGREVHLSRKAFDLLRTLLERRPGVVRKDEILEAVWPNTFVTDANVMVVIGELRRALGDDANQPRYIRTAHGVGYAFCGEAEQEAPPAPRAPSARGPSVAWLVSGQRTFPLEVGEHVIGRDPHCTVWLDDAGVSRRHARLRVTAEDVSAVLEDLRSTNGTFVRGHRITEHVALSDGDVIEIGPVELEFRAGRDPSAATRRVRRKRG
jgi:DNA-binding winged helix-turn-helix (wHTH) protein